MRKLAQTNKRQGIIGIIMLIALSIASCATSDGGYNAGSVRNVTACKTGDTLVSSSTQCLQDSAACYELANGNWCTGERGNTCPSGSVQIPDGGQCPNGTRCIEFGEGLKCAIQVR